MGRGLGPAGLFVGVTRLPAHQYQGGLRRNRSSAAARSVHTSIFSKVSVSPLPPPARGNPANVQRPRLRRSGEGNGVLSALPPLSLCSRCCRSSVQTAPSLHVVSVCTAVVVEFEVPYLFPFYPAFALSPLPNETCRNVGPHVFCAVGCGWAAGACRKDLFIVVRRSRTERHRRVAGPPQENNSDRCTVRGNARASALIGPNLSDSTFSLSCSKTGSLRFAFAD